MEQQRNGPQFLQYLLLRVISLAVVTLSIFDIIMGATHSNECPLQPSMSSHLQLKGVLAPALLLLGYVTHSMGRDTQSEQRSQCEIFTFLFAIGYLIFLVTGIPWDYGVEPNSSPGRPDYCSTALYLYFFFSSVFAILGLGLGLIWSLTLHELPVNTPNNHRH